MCHVCFVAMGWRHNLGGMLMVCVHCDAGSARIYLRCNRRQYRFGLACAHQGDSELLHFATSDFQVKSLGCCLCA